MITMQTATKMAPRRIMVVRSRWSDRTHGSRAGPGSALYQAGRAGPTCHYNPHQRTGPRCVLFSANRPDPRCSLYPANGVIRLLPPDLHDMTPCAHASDLASAGE